MPAGPAEPGPEPDPHLEQQVDERVVAQVEQQVEQQVDRRLGDAAAEAASAAQQAGVGADRAERARDGAEQARDDAAVVAGAAVAAAAAIAPDDPLLDTAVRRIEARATPEQPFGRPGRPMSGRSPFRTAFTAALGVAVAYGLVQAVVGVRSVLVLLLVARSSPSAWTRSCRPSSGAGCRAGRRSVSCC